jgi:hypothetical protein
MEHGRASKGLHGCLSAVRVILAGLFIFVALTMVVGWLAGDGDDLSPWGGAVIMATFVAAIFIAMFLFNPRGSRPSLFGLNEGENLEALERDGILVRESYSATRAFEVAEYEDEGLHYFLELTNGDVLYLTGQLLYQFEPNEGDEDDMRPPQPRRFPCTEFEVLRHRTEGYLADIICHGDVLEPEVVLPHAQYPDWPQGGWLDIDVIRNIPYDDLKSSAS